MKHIRRIFIGSSVALLSAGMVYAAFTLSVQSTVEINDSTANGPVLSNNDGFGDAIARIGDLNNDGVEDIVVGTSQDDEGGSNRGAVHILFMNIDGSVDSTVEINDSTANGPVLANGDLFGFSVAALGDLDGDSVEDIVVGAYGDDEGGSDRGAVHIIFLNTDGSVDSTVEITDSTTNGPVLSNTDGFGTAVATIGDLNGDGVTDIVVGARQDAGGGTSRGAAHIMFLNTDGSVDSTAEINDSTTNGPVLNDSDEFGYGGAAALGDLNNDGVEDIAVGAYGDDTGGSARGTVHIMFLNTDGSIDSTVEINDNTTNGPVLSDFDLFGRAIASLGDLDGDGVIEIAVGAYGDDEGGSGRGAVHIFFMNTDGSIDSTVEINDSTANGPALSNSDAFGYSIASLGDLDSNGIEDMAVGAYLDAEGGSGRGAVHILYLAGATTTDASSNTGTAYQHRRIRERYAEIAAGLHGSAEEERHDTDAPSLADVGIFTPGTGSVLPARTQEQTQKKGEEAAPLSRRVQQVLEKLQSTDEDTVQVQEGSSELSPFVQRVCERVWRRFTGSSLARVNERLQQRLGFVCGE